ncbi:FAD/NAD(P)-binding oxidoreductase, partial [Mycobacterium tuberculosis]
ALHSGVRPLRVLGDEAQGRVTGVAWQDGNEERSVACDAVGFGYALRSETQLADLLGCRFEYAPLHRAHLPVRDAAGRSSV